MAGNPAGKGLFYLMVEYFKGKDISTDKDASKLFVRLDYNF